MKTIYFLSLFFVVVACNNSKTQFTDVFIGTWKMEGKEQYEVWKLNSEKELVGNSYKIIESEKIISETLRIVHHKDKWIYEATVFNQNKGEPVKFIMNTRESELVSFENENHDFPKKIQYKIISSDTMEVVVLGEGNKGFSYIQVRQSVQY